MVYDVKEDDKQKKSFPKNPYRSLDWKPKWELGIWGYIILGVLFLIAVYFLKWDIIPVTIGVVLLIGLWIFWFGVLKRSLWELIALYIFLGYLLLHLSK